MSILDNPVSIFQHMERDQVFSYYHGDGMLHFNATMLDRMRRNMPKDCFGRITIDLDEEQLRLCTEHRGIEEPRVAALRAQDLREPGYAVLFDNDSFTIVDGHHRLVRRFRAGARTMDFWVCTRDIWQHCLVPYTPEEQAALAKFIPPRVDDPATLPTRITVKP